MASWMEEKERFFAELFSLDHSDEDSHALTSSGASGFSPSPRPPRKAVPDSSSSRPPPSGQPPPTPLTPFSPGLQTSPAILPSSNHPSVRPRTAPAAPSSSNPPSSARLATSSAPAVPTSSDPTSSTRFPTSSATVSRKLIQRTQSSGANKSRRKSKDDVRVLPLSEQLFPSQVFFFIRNDAAATHRRRRIEKAQENGAIWARELSMEVTHVIVDSDLTSEDLHQHYGNCPRLKAAAIVTEHWLTESFLYREMRDVGADRFQVQGKFPVCSVPLSSHSRPQSPTKTQSEHASSIPESLSPRRPDSMTSRRPPDALSELVEEVTRLGDQILDMEGSDVSASRQPGFVTSPENVGFRCMERNHGAQKDGPNARTIEILQQMATIYDRTNDQWRTKGYRQAISALGRQKRKVETKQQALAIPLIGTRLAEKIDEIVQTDRLRRLEHAMDDPNDQLLRLFIGIYQVGVPTAQRWIAQGYRTLEQLKNNSDLTPNQRIGLEHYDDFMMRIPRAEVEQLAAIVQGALRQADPHLQMIVAGSYRRGEKDCGDIDVLITKVKASAEQIARVMTGEVVPRLLRKGFLKVALSVGDGPECSKWQGACALPGSGAWRRIDLLFVPWNELGASLIYFTGNDIFNRSIRLLASKKGMRLNQHGLYKDVLRGKNRVKVSEGSLVESHSEQVIFQHLGVLWWEPHERQC